MIEFTHQMPCDSGFLYQWHCNPGAINRLIPSWEKVKILKHPKTLINDSDVELKLTKLFFDLPWHLKISNVIPGEGFTDQQVKGPFARWKHVHKMQPINQSSSLLVEQIDFELPAIMKIGGNFFAKQKLKRLFNFRFQVMTNDLRQHYQYANRKPLRILVSGSSGLVGSRLCDFLTSGGHEVVRLIRDQSMDLNGFDAVVHLAGENIANKRWDKTQKQRILDSRVNGTKALTEQLSKVKNLPKVFVCASAIGFYGDRQNELMDESSLPGKGFLSETCQAWEQACKPALDAGIRVVNTRIGIVLDPAGGALHKILPLFAIGGGGILGNGKQIMSWIALDDVIGGILHCLMHDEIRGPVNLVAPEPLTNREFTKILAKVLKRPSIFPAPIFALRLVLGEMADALLLSSTKVKPAVLENSGYQFSYSSLDSALKHMLGH